MALHTGLRFPHTLAGIMALSGYLPLAERLAAERHPANATTPVFMAHGSQDPVVVPARGESSRDLLSQLGYPVQWHSYPMPHSVHPREVADIGAFLTRVLNQRPTTP
jgi:phospholipase/carboxylesterase